MYNDLVDALATHRLTKLVIDDKITEDFREQIYKHFPPESHKIGYFFTCPWCVSFWMGAGVVAARNVSPKAWRPLAYALAFSSITGWIEEHS
jgi:hypothetical protein